MPRRGQPPKPLERKRATGNPGKRALPTALVALPASDAPPEPTRPLGPAGLELWERVWRRGQRWISPDVDVDLVLLLCEQLDERVALRLTVFRDGRPADRRALRELDRQVVSSLSLLGFTPTDRARLGVAEVQTRSRLEELRRRAAR